MTNAVVSSFLGAAHTIRARLTVDALNRGLCNVRPHAVELPPL